MDIVQGIQYHEKCVLYYFFFLWYNPVCLLIHYFHMESILQISTFDMSWDDGQLQDSLLHSRAYWVNKSLIAWNVDIEDGSCFLYASKCASLAVTDDGIQGPHFTKYGFNHLNLCFGKSQFISY